MTLPGKLITATLLALLIVPSGALALEIAPEPEKPDPGPRRPPRPRREDRPAAETVETPEPSDKPRPEDASRLVRELADERYEVRIEARKGLLALGPPALAALRAAKRSEDIEVAQTAEQLVEAIEAEHLESQPPGRRLVREEKGRRRTTVNVSSTGARLTGDLEVFIECPADTVRVHARRKVFAVEIKRDDGRMAIYSEPTEAEFKREYPDIYERYAAAALDESDPDAAFIEAMVRTRMPEMLEAFEVKHGRVPNGAEKKSGADALRATLRELLAESRAKKEKEETPAERPKPRPRRPVSGPTLHAE